MESIKDNENIIIDENNTQPELSYEELIDKNEQEFLNNQLNQNEENEIFENLDETIDETFDESETDSIME